MRRLVLGDVRDDAAEALGVCRDDAIVVRRINQAQERLLNRSTDPVGSWMRYRVCTRTDDSGCFALPRQVLHVKAFWVCNTPGMVMSEWYENLGYFQGGVGLVDADCGGDRLIDQGQVVSYNNVFATQEDPRKIQVVATHPSDDGKFITLRYYDSNGARVYTNIDGVVQEGERLALSTTGTLTSHNVMTGGLYFVVKAVTNYPVRVYAYDESGATQVSQLAVYEPSETVPTYRSVKLPLGGCGRGTHDDDEDEDGCPTQRPVTLAVRLQHVPVVVDNDPLVVGNLYALTQMVRGQELRRRNEPGLAQEAEAQAAAEIDGEIAAYLGDGVTPIVRTPDRDTWGGAVFNPIGGGYGFW